MQLEFFVEEPSMEAALINLVPNILSGKDFEFEIHVYQGKPNLIKSLPQRLKAYRNFRDNDLRLIILVDRDDDDCKVLKKELEEIAEFAKLPTKSNPDSDGLYVLINRIAIEELEAWFFGDVDALRTAYPKVKATLEKQAKFRDPDAIRGGTWEALERELVYHHPGGLAKIKAADEISQHMRPDKNRSRSFQVFRDALLEIFAPESA